MHRRSSTPTMRGSHCSQCKLFLDTQTINVTTKSVMVQRFLNFLANRFVSNCGVPEMKSWRKAGFYASLLFRSVFNVIIYLNFFYQWKLVSSKELQKLSTIIAVRNIAQKQQKYPKNVSACAPWKRLLYANLVIIKNKEKTDSLHQFTHDFAVENNWNHSKGCFDPISSS